MRTVKEEQLQKEVEIWKSRANAHERNYLQLLKRIDALTKQLKETPWKPFALSLSKIIQRHIWEKDFKKLEERLIDLNAEDHKAEEPFNLGLLELCLDASLAISDWDRVEEYAKRIKTLRNKLSAQP